MVDIGSQSSKLGGLKSWPVTIVAIFFFAQGLSTGYAAFWYAGQPALSGGVGRAAIFAITCVLLIVAGAGLLVRAKACLTLAVVLAGSYLASAGSNAAGAIFAPTPSSGAAALAFVVVGWLQYVILRSQSTTALFQ